jgi:hypothetical protein
MSKHKIYIVRYALPGALFFADTVVSTSKHKALSDKRAELESLNIRARRFRVEEFSLDGYDITVTPKAG